jgi:phage terminase small subunit
MSLANPLIKIARDAAELMVRYGGEFGLGPASRARIASCIRYEPPSKFSGLLAE